MFSILKFSGAQVTSTELASVVFTISITMFRYVSACIVDLFARIIEYCWMLGIMSRFPFIEMRER